jgi:hypothetical protein
MLCGRSDLLARTVRKGGQTDCQQTSLAESRTVRPKGFALVQKNSNSETRSVVSPHANATIYALRGTKFYINKVH